MLGRARAVSRGLAEERVTSVNPSPVMISLTSSSCKSLQELSICLGKLPGGIAGPLSVSSPHYQIFKALPGDCHIPFYHITFLRKSNFRSEFPEMFIFSSLLSLSRFGCRNIINNKKTVASFFVD